MSRTSAPKASRRPADSGPRAELAALLSPVVAGFGADLEDVTVSRAGSRSVVRVVVDRDGGLDLDAVADVSRAVSDALDGEEAERLLRGSFVLEVSTPGVDRPLTEPRHWRRARGRLVSVTRRTGGPLLARVREAGDDRVVLTGEDLPGGEVEVDYADVSRAVVQVEFHPVGAEADPEETGGPTP
jgi:ribosome maturation factor RimP